jgi:hypothetical protein
VRKSTYMCVCTARTSNSARVDHACLYRQGITVACTFSCVHGLLMHAYMCNNAACAFVPCIGEKGLSAHLEGRDARACLCCLVGGNGCMFLCCHECNLSVYVCAF